MTSDGLHPALVLFAAALLVPLLPRGRSLVSVLAPVAAFLAFLGLGEGSHGGFEWLGFAIEPLRVDRLGTLFVGLFCLASFVGSIFAWHVRDRLQQAAALAYAGSAVGAVLAGDLLTLFVFWELLALTSAALVVAPRTRRALASGLRYLVWNVLSGVLLLVGALWLQMRTGSIAFDRIALDGAGAWLLLLAFGIKAGFPYAHTWLIDAYPNSTPTGTVFLSAFTTKTAVYALARAFPGADVLVVTGAVMTLFPIFYAVIENDLRKVLSYSMINQIGFMVVGIGIGSELALNGAVAHAFADVVFKGLLFMSMGAVLHVTGRVKGTELGGLYKTMPKTAALCIVGALSISAMPLFSAFVTKSMILEAALREHRDWLFFVLLFASAGVLEHAGIKIPYFAFFAHDSGVRAKEPPRGMLLGMTAAAVVCVAIGSFPSLLYRHLPFEVDFVPYTASHVLTQVQLLFFAALAVHVLIRTGVYPPETAGVNLDLEWTYRRLGLAVWRRAWRVLETAWTLLFVLLRSLADVALEVAKHLHGVGGLLARPWPIGTGVLFAALLLGLYLLLYAVAG